MTSDISFTAASISIIQSMKTNKNNLINESSNESKNDSRNNTKNNTENESKNQLKNVDNNELKNENKKQIYFGEHTDDIISIAVYQHNTTNNSKSNTNNKNNQGNIVPKVLIATGEIGKIPAIHISSYDAKNGRFAGLACIKGFHKKGVVQLCFSDDGSRLFTVGLEYSVAVYNSNTEEDEKTFGKMVGV